MIGVLGLLSLLGLSFWGFADNGNPDPDQQDTDDFDNEIGGTEETELITGTGLADYVFGDAGDETIRTGFGADAVDGGDGNDTLRGGFGNDSLVGGNGNDFLRDTSGNNTMEGGAGNDFMFAGEDSDTLNGGAGQDTVNGGGGDDLLILNNGDLAIGGDGADTFQATVGTITGTDVPTINDYTASEDMIVVQYSGAEPVVTVAADVGTDDALIQVDGTAIARVTGGGADLSAITVGVVAV